MLRVAGGIALLLLSALATAQPQLASRHQLQAWQSQFAALPAAEQARILQAQRDYLQLPEAQQQQLRARFDQLDRLHRDGWRLGPRLGRYWPGLQPLFGYLDQAERAPVLVMLHGLDDGALEVLVRLSERTPPGERAQLRQQLLAQPPASRGQWLRARVGP